MRMEQSFEVKAPIDQVWTALIDVEKVAPCLPGATVTGHDDDGTYHGTFTVKLGPMTAAYRGTIKIEEAEAASHTATLAARGTDKRGQGGATATIVNTLHETDEGTRVDAVTEFSITGRLATFGRGGVIQDVSNRLLHDFATCLQQRLAGEPGGALTAEEAAASAGAGEAVGGSPAELSGKSPAEVSGKSPGELGGSSQPPAAAQAGSPDAPAAGPSQAPPTPARTGPSEPPAATPPVKGISLLLSVLWERIRRLFRRR
jgi:carbon monoxide dehydrogenase subunit G